MPRSTSHTVAALLLCATCELPVAASAATLDSYLPKSGTIEGHVMTFSIAPENQALAHKFREAVQSNMDWFKKAVTSNPAGTPLPYDPKMGITEAQYQQLLHMKSDAHQGAPIEVAVKRAADGTIGFAPKGEVGAALQGVSFPADEKTAATPFGPLTIFNEIHQKDVAAPIGIWNGAEWAQVAADGSDQPSVKIAFGKREDGSGVMYYQVAPYDGHKEQSLVVFYPLD